MNERKLSRRNFLAMLGVVVGAGAAGGWAWLRTGDTVPPVSTPEVAPGEGAAPTTPTASGSGSTVTPVESQTLEASVSLPTTAAVLPGVTGSREVICKEAWGAGPIKGQLVDHQIARLTVHHTAVLMGSNTEAPSRIRSYQNYHQGNGWPDVAYHYLIDANDHIYEGRPVSARGDTFTGYDTTGHFLVCCDGHFDQQGIPDAQLASLANVLAWASVAFGVGPSTIAGHRDYAATDCPGSHLAALIADRTVQSMVEQRIAAGVNSLSSLCGQAGLDRVAAIEAGRL